MDNQSASPEQMASASSGITFATTAMAAVGCVLGTGTIIAMWLSKHPFGEQLTGFQVASSLIVPLIAGFVPVVLMLLFGGKSKDHEHCCGHCSH